MSDSKVTLKDIYDAVERLEDKMTKRIEANEAEIRNVQNSYNRLIGQLSVLTVFASAVSTYVWKRIIGE